MWNHSSMTKEDKYLSTLNDSKFCPIFRGNNVETFRMYECLEAVQFQYMLEVMKILFWKFISNKLGLINIESWEKAKDMIKTLLSDNPMRAEEYRQMLNTNGNCGKRD
jgi:hypothetical protein